MPVAQLDRALGCGPKGRGFKSPQARQGEMAEWLKAAVSKTAVSVRAPEVRILLSPRRGAGVV